MNTGWTTIWTMISWRLTTASKLGAIREWVVVSPCIEATYSTGTCRGEENDDTLTLLSIMLTAWHVIEAPDGSNRRTLPRCPIVVFLIAMIPNLPCQMRRPRRYRLRAFPATGYRVSSASHPARAWSTFAPS